MVHHKLLNVAQKLETVKTAIFDTIQMIEEEKRYPVIMQ